VALKRAGYLVRPREIQQNRPVEYELPNDEPVTIFTDAVLRSDFVKCQRMLDSGMSIDVTNKLSSQPHLSGITALMRAAALGRLEAVEFLLARGQGSRRWRRECR
jgi:ankyrin repeat protein